MIFFDIIDSEHAVRVSYVSGNVSTSEGITLIFESRLVLIVLLIIGVMVTGHTNHTGFAVSVEIKALVDLFR